MTKEIASQGSLSRRQLLKGVVSAAALVSASPLRISGYHSAVAGTSAPRMRETFDFGWMFRKGDLPGAEMPDFSESGWKNVDLPHDWSIDGPFNEIESSSYC